MTKRNNGFALLEVIVVVVIVGLVALVGVKVYGAHQDKTANQTGVSQAENQAQLQAATASVPEIKSAADLDRASQVLDQNDPGAVNSNDSAQLDKDIDSL